MKKFAQENRHQRKKNFRLIAKILTLNLILLIVFQVLFANQLVEKGGQIKELNTKIDASKKENQELTGIIAKETSLDSIKAKAKNLGMIDLTSVIYLSTPLPIALNQ